MKVEKEYLNLSNLFLFLRAKTLLRLLDRVRLVRAVGPVAVEGILITTLSFVNVHPR